MIHFGCGPYRSRSDGRGCAGRVSGRRGSRAVAEIAAPGQIPFDIIAGISAGAINGVGLATLAEDFQEGAKRLTATWAALTPDRIFRTGALRLASIGSRWIRDLSAGGLIGKSGINYLLDSGPLRRLISTEIPIGRMRRHLRAGRLRGVAVSATNYHTGSGVTFFEGAAEIEPWTRSTRIGIRQRITVEHVMASAAIPVFFPPVALDGSFYGDGCVRMNYPMSPAIHLGADRIVAVSVRHLRRPVGDGRAGGARRRPTTCRSPRSPGVLLNAVFLDSVDSDRRAARPDEPDPVAPPAREAQGPRGAADPRARRSGRRRTSGSSRPTSTSGSPGCSGTS